MNKAMRIVDKLEFLTELHPENRELVKAFFESISELFENPYPLDPLIECAEFKDKEYEPLSQMFWEQWQKSPTKEMKKWFWAWAKLRTKILRGESYE